MTHLHSTGQIVRCLVCDESSSTITAIKVVGFSLTNPQIKHPTTGRKVKIIFDPPI